jgi:hypothetical protein
VMVMTAVMAVATCCGSVAVAALRGASLVVAAAPPVTRGPLDERRLIGLVVSDLSTLAAARGGARSASPCERKDRKSNSYLSRTGCLGSDCLPQGGEALLPLPRGLDGRRGHG